MAKRPATAKALFKQLEGNLDASRANLTIKFGDSLLPIHLPDAGIVTGDDYGALKIGNATYLLELDRKGANRSIKVVSEPDTDKLAAIVKQLLPEPEEPEEVKAAREALASFAVPKGYKLTVDAKGNPTLVEANGGESHAGGRVPKPKSEPKPPLAVGMLLMRNKDGHTYKVTGLDARLKKAFFEPEGEGEKGLAAGYPAPVFFKNWKFNESE